MSVPVVRPAIIAVTLVLSSAADSLAQATAPRRPAARPAVEQRLFVSIDAGAYASAREFEETVTFRENAEDGRIETAYGVSSAPVLSIAGGAVVWRNLGVAVGVTRFSKALDVPVTAAVPHPFFFNQPRSIEGVAESVTREELAVHVQARMVVPVARNWQVMVFGGPSFFSVTHGLVNDVEFTESYPYDEATFGRAVVADVKESKVGVNLGGDVAYYFTRSVGVGGTVMFSGTQIDLPSAGRTVEVKVGGPSAGAGIRFRF